MFIDKETEVPLDFFITSDTWFGRPQILEIANRMSFSSIEDMNDKLIKNWNKHIKKGDTVFHLGNFAWDPQTARNVLKKLNGEITFILGNCDDALLEVESEFDNIIVLDDQILELPQTDSIICHYPLEVWNGKDSGTIHFHGHTVFSHKTDLRVSNRVNVCVDFWNYAPIKFSTIKEFINGKK
jgi:calcineurin-like phosphoesterase family protein